MTTDRFDMEVRTKRIWIVVDVREDIPDMDVTLIDWLMAAPDGVEPEFDLYPGLETH